MRYTTTLLGTIMGVTAILYAAWIYFMQTFVVSTTTVVTLPADPHDLGFLTMGSAILQILAAGFAQVLRPVSVALAALATAGYAFASLDGPDLFVAWAVSAGVMAGLVLIEIAIEMVGIRLQRQTTVEIPDTYLFNEAGVPTDDRWERRDEET